MAIDITYNAPPTVSRFILCEDRLSFILGPIGCTDADTEFLTPSGWKRMADYAEGDLVAQWRESGEIEFVTPEEYVVLPQVGPFHRFRNAYSMDMILSDEHRVPFYDWKGALRVETAGYVAHKLQTLDGEGPRFMVPVTFRLGDRPGVALTDAEIRVMVAVHADGYFPQYYKERDIPRCVVCVRKERKKARLRELLVAAGIDYAEKTYVGRPTETNFTFMAPMLSKTYGVGWWDVTQEQAQIIYDEFGYWDGLVHEDGEVRFSTTVSSDADFIQFICHATGHRATISDKGKPEEHWANQYLLHATRRLDERVTFRNAEYSQVESRDGKKYCFVVPTGFFVARCNGKVFITGNSGKSVGCCMKIMRIAMGQEPGTDGIRRTRFTVVRNTRDQLKDTTLKTWLAWFPSRAGLGYWKETDRTYYMDFTPPDGIPIKSEVMFRALDDPDDVAKVLSLETTAVWFNECREVDREILEQASKRAGRYPEMKQKPDNIHKDNWPTWYGTFGDTNAPELDSYWHAIFEHMPVDEEDPESVVSCTTFIQPPGDSPDAENIENLPTGYYDRGGRSEEWYRTMVQVQYARSLKGKPVYEKVFKHGHISPVPLKIIPYDPVIIGLDTARTPAAVFMQMRDGRIFKQNEAVGFDMGAKTFIPMKLRPILRQQYPTNPVIVVYDPSSIRKDNTGDDSWVTELKRLLPRDDGHYHRPAHTNDPVARINALDNALFQWPGGEPMVVYDPKCKMLLEGLRSKYRYARIKGSDGKYHDRPEKNNWSHVCEADQYGTMFLTGKHYDASDYTRVSYDPLSRQFQTTAVNYVCHR